MPDPTEASSLSGPFQAPLQLLAATVGPERVNGLGHMRAAEYVALFDDGFLDFVARTGLTDSNLLHAGTSPFLLELNARYLRELRAGDQVRIAAQVLGADERRARLLLTMHVEPSGAAAATCELSILNMHLATRRPTPWSPAQAAIWAALAAANVRLTQPSTKRGG